MKKLFILIVCACALIASSATSYAAVHLIDLSPGSGLASNLGLTSYTQDFAIGLAGANVGEPDWIDGDGERAIGHQLR